MITAKQAAADKTLTLSFSKSEARDYSYGDAIISALNPKESSFTSEVSQTIQASLGRPPRTGNSIFVPSSLRPRASALETRDNVSGGYATQIAVRDYVDCLRAQMRLAALGATFLPGLRYSALFPVESSSTSATWLSEDPGSDVSQVDITFGFVTASPKTLQATTSVSRQLLAQCSGNIDLETRLRMDLSKSHAEAFDLAAIGGSGSSGQPVGLLQTAGIGSVACGVNGATPTYGVICDLEAAVANASAADNIGFLSTPDIRKLLRRTGQLDSTYSSIPVWQGDSMLGKLALVSKNVPSTLSKGTSNGTLSAILAGVWSELILAEFGALELVADQYAQKRQGMIEVTSFGLYDCVIPRPAAFAAVLDAALS